MSFRIGLFGLEKLHNIDRSVAQLEAALTQLGFTEKLPVAA
jgi:aspartate aminotransferase-like enzyme